MSQNLQWKLAYDCAKESTSGEDAWLTVRISDREVSFVLIGDKIHIFPGNSLPKEKWQKYRQQFLKKHNVLLPELPRLNQFLNYLKINSTNATNPEGYYVLRHYDPMFDDKRHIIFHGNICKVILNMRLKFGEDTLLLGLDDIDGQDFTDETAESIINSFQKNRTVWIEKIPFELIY